MKKKLFILATICAMSFGAQQLNASNPNPFITHVTEKSMDGKEIDLQGSCCSLVSTTTAKKNSNTVCLTFSQNIGHVDVLLYDDNGSLVYSCSVDTAVQKMAMLPTTGDHDGTYTIVVENTSDTAVGQFERR